MRSSSSAVDDDVDGLSRNACIRAIHWRNSVSSINPLPVECKRNFLNFIYEEFASFILWSFHSAFSSFYSSIPTRKKTFNFQRAENFPFRSQSTEHSHDECLEANEEIYEWFIQQTAWDTQAYFFLNWFLFYSSCEYFLPLALSSLIFAFSTLRKSFHFLQQKSQKPNKSKKAPNILIDE